MIRFYLIPVLICVAWGHGEDENIRFEVASIKPSPKYEMVFRRTGGPGTSDPTRFRVSNAGLSTLMRIAYAVQADQIKGPGWIDTNEFDVVANVPPGTTVEQFRKMLQNLLAERFRLQAHHETQTVAADELRVAKNGPKLKVAAEGTGVDDFVPGKYLGVVGPDEFPFLPPGRSNFSCANGPDGSHCTYRMMTMNQFAERLIAKLDRRVVDKTTLTGQYDFALYFRIMDGAPTEPNDGAPRIEQAVREQLGLELVVTKVSIDVLVIDHAEKIPADN